MIDSVKQPINSTRLALWRYRPKFLLRMFAGAVLPPQRGSEGFVPELSGQQGRGGHPGRGAQCAGRHRRVAQNLQPPRSAAGTCHRPPPYWLGVQWFATLKLAFSECCEVSLIFFVSKRQSCCLCMSPPLLDLVAMRLNGHREMRDGVFMVDPREAYTQCKVNLS